VEVIDSLFTKNSAIEGSIFYVTYQSLLILNHCEIVKNFALSGGIGKVDSDGRI
jgi:hypothetical protein